MQRLIFKSDDENNKAFPIPIIAKKSSLISQVKESLAAKLKVDSSRIVIKYKGEVLPGSRLISDYNISSPNFITYHINDNKSDSLVAITLVNGPGAPIKLQDSYTVNGAIEFIAKILNLPADNIHFEKTSMNGKTLLKNIPLEKDGTIHFVYKYKLLNFYVYLPNKLIAKSRCRDFAIVDTVKAVLAKRLNVPPETTVLTYNDEILANDMKIRDVKFTKDGVFKLEPYKPKSPIKKINIKIENSGIAKVRFNEKATIGKAKEKLAQFLNCEPQNISLLVNDPSINDQSLLKDVEIESEGTLDASLSPSKAPSSPVKTISIRLSNGLIAKGRYTESATIKKMKEVLAKTLNTSPEYLSVIKNDPDESLIKDINEYSDADLSVQIDDEYLRPVTFLMSDGKKVNAHFKNSAKIGRIKEILAKTLNVVPERIIFNFSRKVGNNEQLKNLPIDEDGIISTTISSFAKKQTKEFSDSEPEYNYSAEDEFIEEEEEEEEINDSRFVDNENVNQKESQKDNDIEKGSENESIHDYDAEEEGRNNYSEEIPSGSPAHSLILRTQNGQVAKTRFKDTATVGKVKDKMAEVLDANPANMSLSFDSKILDDNSFVKDVAPPEGVLLLKQSPTKLKVVKPLILKLEDGTEIKSRFRMVTTIEKVKETLGNILNYDPGRLVCYYEDEALANDLFLSEINIHDNECIYVSKE